MTIEGRYEHENGRRMSVVYPKREAPYVPQSNYVFGARDWVDLCRSINATSKSIFDLMMKAEDDQECAAYVTGDVLETIIAEMNFERAGMLSIADRSEEKDKEKVQE